MPHSQPILSQLDGSWERAERNPALGVIILVLLLGSLYYLLGNLSSLIIMVIKALPSLGKQGSDYREFLRAFAPNLGGGDYLENLKETYARNRTLILGVTVCSQFLLFLAPSLYFGRRWFSSQVASYMGYRRAPLFGVVAGLAAAILVLPLVDAISRLTDSLFPQFTKLNEAAAVLYRWDSPLEAIFVFFSISITPAICEEALFRGIFQRGLQRRLAFPWSFIVSGITFAFFHQSALSLAALIPVGILLGFLYWAYDSIWVGMALHALYNGAILLLVNGRLVLPSILMDGDYFSPPVWIISSLALGALCVLIARAALKRRGKNPQDGGTIPSQEASQGE